MMFPLYEFPRTLLYHESSVGCCWRVHFSQIVLQKLPESLNRDHKSFWLSKIAYEVKRPTDSFSIVGTSPLPQGDFGANHS